MDRDGVDVHKLAKKEGDQYPAILTQKAWSIKENVSRYEAFVRLYSFFSGPFGFRNLRESLLVIYLNCFWHKTYFIHRIFKRTAVDAG